jgi:ubiquinone/menaquinone biosynthesis C-methylase UbiE
MPIRYHSQTVKKETLHTVSLVAPHLDRGMTVLDVGCGEGYVGAELSARGVREAWGADILDLRRDKCAPFRLYDGQTLPFPDDAFDLVMLNFVLHHVPDDKKIALVREALRVTRAKLFVLEDTPTTAFDRYVSQRHGDAYRRKIDSDASFGFLTPAEWQWLFRGMGLEPVSHELSRFCRSVLQPFARTAFTLRKPRGAELAVEPSPPADEGSSAGARRGVNASRRAPA